MANRLQAVNGPMPPQIWDYSRCSEQIVLRAICRAIDLADAMQCVVCIDLEAGSAIVNPGSSFEEVLEVYFDLRQR